jgi:murein DD-endopeptidase MepM/ murein hydrolase activator NlpD
MQVIFLPSGSGPRRNYRVRVAAVSSLAAGLLLAVASAGGYLGYLVGHGSSGQEAAPHTTMEHGVAERQRHLLVRDVAAHENNSLPVISAEKLVSLKTEVDEQRKKLQESRQRLGDQLDSLGQRLGQIQAHVSRLNALGQQLTDMAGLDPDEFSFDKPPAMGGPERPVPWGRIHEPELSESLELIEIALDKKENELQVLEALLTDRELHKKQYPQGWPAQGGWISSGYGYRTDPFTGRRAFHEGVDIAARAGTGIRALADGVVSYAGRKPGYGLVVEINHGNGYQTRYAHARKLIAKVGQRVRKGDTVALVGSTGRSTGAHVHVEVLKNGQAVNPRMYLSAAR